MKRLIAKDLSEEGFDKDKLSAGFGGKAEYALDILRENIQGDKLVVYHGTLEEYVDNIMSEGLQGDPTRTGYGPAFSTQRGQAITFGIERKKMEDSNSNIAILTIEIPKSEWDMIEQNVSDTAYQYGDYGNVIPSDWITNVEIKN
jgi:hypothetical protein